MSDARRESLADELRQRIRPIFKRSLFLFAVVFGYLVVGAFLFHAIEYAKRDDSIEDATEKLELERAQLMKVLWAETIAKSEDDWAEIANERLDLYEKSLKQYLRLGIDLQDDFESAGGDEDNPWSLTGSLFYCFTIVTTIGYGNVAPTTLAGKLATVVYATIGIPLSLCLLTEMGKLLTLVLKLSFSSSRLASEDTSEDFNYSVPVALAITMAYLSIGIVVFWDFESDWTFADAGYFTFISFSTIGLGDLCPSCLELNIVLMAYIFSAMALVSMCFCVIQNSLTLKLDDWFERAETATNDHRERLGRLMGRKGTRESLNDEDQQANASGKNGPSSGGEKTSKIPKPKSSPKITPRSSPNPSLRKHLDVADE